MRHHQDVNFISFTDTSPFVSAIRPVSGKQKTLLPLR
jgi:hypothetical protein